MTTNYIIEKYNNLNLEEDFVNNYLYKPINLKYAAIVQFKKPKKFYINRAIEDFRTNKKGNLKTLREFQNLYIHKFIISPKNKEKKIKFHFSFGIKKEEKNKNKYNKNVNNINNEIEKQIPISQIDSLKRTNILLYSSKTRNGSYYIKRRSNQLINNNNQHNIKTTSINSSSLNKKCSYINDKLKNNRNFSSFSFKYENEKSKLTLIKELSQKILNKKKKDINEFQRNNHYSLKKKNLSFFNESQNSRNDYDKLNKNKNYERNKKNYKYNLKKNNQIQNNKYIEISRNDCDFSDAYIIQRQVGPNSATTNKIKKRQKIPLRLFSSDVKQMSTLERYYLKFGVFPF